MEPITFSGGHTETILCIQILENATILSCGENGEVCLWSHNGAVLQTLHLDKKHDVLSAVGSKNNPHFIYLTSGSCVKKFDLRNFTVPVEDLSFESDEINQIILSEDEKYLAVADDSGFVTVYNLPEKKVARTLRKHANICSSVAFRPGKINELYSASYDKTLIHWDFHRVRALNTINMDELDHMSSDSVSKYLINPPFIHSLAVSDDGTFVTCGTENARIHVFNGHRRSLEYIYSLEGHRLGVSQVLFPIKDQTGLLLSGGNDGQIFLWRLPTVSNKKTAREEAVIKPWHTISHGNKVNWLATSSIETNSLSLFVCDNSSMLTKYSVGQI